jgi:hypothetical protein
MVMQLTPELRKRTIVRAALTSTVLWITGCGQPTTEISGVVSLDGQPIPKASLEFFPVSGKGRVSFTTTDAAGRYRVEVFPTTLKVIVTATKVNGKVQDPYGPEGQMMDRVVNALPEEYGYQEKTPLTAEPVAGQTTTIDFALTSSEK